jgi:hypothetical protein
MWDISSVAVKDLSYSNNMFICMYFQSPGYWFIYGIHYFEVNHLNSPWQYLTGLYELAVIFKFLRRSGMYSNTFLVVKLVPHIQRTWITSKNYSKLFFFITPFESRSVMSYRFKKTEKHSPLWRTFFSKCVILGLFVLNWLYYRCKSVDANLTYYMLHIILLVTCIRFKMTTNVGHRVARLLTSVIYCSCLFVFLALQPIVVVFSQPDSGL